MIRRSAVLLCLLLFASVAMAFVLIDDTHDQTVGGTKTHVFPDIGQVTFATMAANILTSPPADGQLQYCTDCLADTTPCTGGGSGAMATRVNGQWDCGVGACTAGTTPTPLTFGTPGVIPVFASTELGSYAGAACATPQVVTGISAAGALTCATAGGSTCPAGANTDVQYNDSSSCGGDANFTWIKGTSHLNVTYPTPASTPTPGTALITVTNGSNHTGAGAGVLIASAGTAATADEWVAYDSGVGGDTNRYLFLGRPSVDGQQFRILTNSSFIPDIHTGTGWFEVDPNSFAAGIPQVRFAEMGTSTVPGIGWINDPATGVSYTSSGGLQRSIYHLINNVPSFFEEHVVTGSNVVAINQRFRLIANVPSALSGAGPSTLVPVNALEEVSTSNAGGTAVQLDITNIQEGSIVTVMNTSANDLTFQTASGGGICQKTAGGALQTLADDGSTIEFMAHSSCWVQIRAVMNPS